MAAVNSAARCVMDPHFEGQQNGTVDRLKKLYPAVNEEKTPLPRAWSPKEKYNLIGLSQNNLRVHYKGERACDFKVLAGVFACFGPPATPVDDVIDRGGRATRASEQRDQLIVTCLSSSSTCGVNEMRCCYCYCVRFFRELRLFVNGAFFYVSRDGSCFRVVVFGKNCKFSLLFLGAHISKINSAGLIRRCEYGRQRTLDENGVAADLI